MGGVSGSKGPGAPKFNSRVFFNVPSVSPGGVLGQPGLSTFGGQMTPQKTQQAMGGSGSGPSEGGSGNAPKNQSSIGYSNASLIDQPQGSGSASMLKNAQFLSSSGTP